MKSENRIKIRKWATRSLYSVLIMMALTGVAVATYFLINDWIPAWKSKSIRNELLNKVASSSGQKQIDLINDILIEHNIGSTGRKNYNEYLFHELTDSLIPAVEKLAIQGNADAEFRLGCYFDGAEFSTLRFERRYSTHFDPERAAYWYKEAADQGHATAQANLSDCYISGRGVAEDHVKALHYARLSAAQNDKYGLNILGDLFRDGIKVVEGERWIKDPDCYSCKYAHSCTIHTYPTYRIILPQNIDSAKICWQKAYESGYEDARLKIERIY